MSDSSSGEADNRRSAANNAILKRFWNGNIRIMLILLAVWALAGLGCGVLFAEQLNEFQLGGFPLGFWFAQQGSIIVFVLLILVFCIVMNKRDDEHSEELKKEENQSGGGI